VNYLPYSCQSITPEDVDAVTTVLRSEYLTQGPVIPAFERAFSALQQIPHAVAVSSATAGLHVACLALGVGPGSSVWTSPNSFLASANCALYCGATVDFVDIDPTTRNMSVPLLTQKLEAAERSGKLPHVVIPVDFSGLPCDLREMRALADRYGFQILEDASHATGASYLGQPTGSEYAAASVFSFHAVKIVTTAEGGLIATRDPGLARRMRFLRSHGMSRDADDLENCTEGAWYYEQHFLGYNYRITEVQAALGLSQLKRLPEMHARRKALAARYDELLTPLPVIRPVNLPDRESAWHLYAIEIDDTSTDVTRREVFDKLRSAGIGVNVHYIPIHTQPYYRRLGFRGGSFPNSERYYQRTLSIPLYPTLSEPDQDRVIAALRSALEG
jgi:UDP-4-amino-4,6-dideoxy-N-acetyl-beta-L-altrosamine transaminase